MDAKFKIGDKVNEAIAKVLEGFDKSVFVRNTAKDGSPDWALEVLPYIQAMAVLQAHIDELNEQVS